MVATALPSPPPTTFDAQLGPFRLIRPLGRGGMAEVWRAEWDDGRGGLPVPVAFKRILPWLVHEGAVVRMFLDETRLALQLRHPHIVRALDAGQLGGIPYLALELIDGIDLLAIIRKAAAPPPVGFALHVAHAVAGALAYAHQLRDGSGRWLGLVHRDVSPSNVMLGHDGAIKLLDFGVAKAAPGLRRETTRFGLVKGKPGYIAPELLGGATCDGRADLFSLGAVLWELLTRRRLFYARDEDVLARLNHECAVVAPSQHNPAVAPAVDALVLRALARDPAQRFQAATEMEAMLAEACAQHPWRREDSDALLRASAAVTASGAARGTDPLAATARAVSVAANAAAQRGAPASTARSTASPRRPRARFWAPALTVTALAAALGSVAVRGARRTDAAPAQPAASAPPPQQPQSLPDPPRLGATSAPAPARPPAARSRRAAAAATPQPSAPSRAARAPLDLRHLLDPLAIDGDAK